MAGATPARVSRAVKDFAGFLGSSFVRALANIDLKLGDKGVGEASFKLKAVQEIRDEYRAAAHPEKPFLNDFEATLKDWADSTIGKRERLCIFIDDLDRCMPDVALEVLEALKLYLNIPNIVFITGIDRDVINQLVQHYYRNLGLDEQKSRDYLAKMFQVEVQVSASEEQIEGYLKEQIASLDVSCGAQWNRGLSEREKRVFSAVALDLARGNPRRIKRLLNSMLLKGTAAAQCEPPSLTFAQGIQHFLLQDILSGLGRLSGTLYTKSGNDFLRGWSAALVKSNLPLRVTEGSKIAAGVRSPEPEVESRSRADLASQVGNEESFEDFLRLLRAQRFDPYVDLLANETLAKLLSIAYPEDTSFAAAGSGRQISEALALEAAAMSLGKGADDLMQADRASVRTLVVREPEFTAASVLAQFHSLVDLCLDDTGVSDLRPLRRLRELRKLSLVRSRVSDIAPLGDLPELQFLDLGDSEVESVETLAGRSALAALYLTATKIDDIGPLAECSGLVELYLGGAMRVRDLPRVWRTPNLRRLVLHGTAVSDLSSLGQLAGLTMLYVGRTRVADLGALSRLPLSELSVEHSSVTDLAPLAGITTLQVLDLSSTQPTDLTPVAGLPHLSSLSLAGVSGVDLEPLAGAASLRRLRVDEGTVTDRVVDLLRTKCPNLQFDWGQPR